jgi:hypothetical protein
MSSTYIQRVLPEEVPGRGLGRDSDAELSVSTYRLCSEAEEKGPIHNLRVLVRRVLSNRVALGSHHH